MSLINKNCQLPNLIESTNVLYVVVSIAVGSRITRKSTVANQLIFQKESQTRIGIENFSNKG